MAESRELTLGTVNLNNHRVERGQRPDLEAVADAGARVILVQEATWPLSLPGFDTHQPRRRDGQVCGEAILTATELLTRRPGAQLVADGHLSTPEHPLRDRFLVWEAVRTPLGWVRVLSVHRLPRDYPDALRAPTDAALRVRTRLHRRWVAGGDWNDRLPGARVVGEHLAGPRIDLWFGSAGVVGAARPGQVIPFPDRDDGHPAVLLRLSSAATSAEDD